MDLFQNNCFIECKNIVVEKNLRVTLNFYKKLLPPVYHIKDIYQSKVVPIRYTLEKKFSAAAAFEGLWVVVYFVVYFDLYESSLEEEREEKRKRSPSKYCL